MCSAASWRVEATGCGHGLRRAVRFGRSRRPAALAADMPGTICLPPPTHQAPPRVDVISPAGTCAAISAGHWGIIDGAQSARRFRRPDRQQSQHTASPPASASASRRRWAAHRRHHRLRLGLKYEGTVAAPGRHHGQDSGDHRAVQRLSRSRHLVPDDALYRRRRRRRLYRRHGYSSTGAPPFDGSRQTAMEFRLGGDGRRWLSARAQSD